MNDDETNRTIHTAYRAETGHYYERPPITPLTGMPRSYWYGMLVIAALLAAVFGGLVWLAGL